MSNLLFTLSGLFVVQNPSFLATIKSFGSYIGQTILNWLMMLLNWFLGILWTLVRWVLGVMEAFEYIINSFLGIGVGPGELYEEAKNLQFMDTLVKVFKALFGVAIVLLIIFTIYAIIKQEVRNAQNGFDNSGENGSGNDKKGIMMRMFKSFMGMVLLPLCMIFILYGVNAALSSFNRALKGPTGATVASQVLASSTYDANRYRKYAETNKRMPIIIEAYDANEPGTSSEDLKFKIKSGAVQKTLLETAISIKDGTFLSFANSVTYKNNKLTNSSNFGSIYENFICTAEQYQVMADFIDFAEITGTTFYIKAMDEKDIEWKYVDSSIYNKDENSLTIKYRDASDINKNGNTSDTYEITYKMSYEVTSPISDALNSIMAMLGIGEYGDNLYKVMERDEDFLNLVQWSTEKVLIKFSKDFDATDPSTWTVTDQIIIYEFYHFSSNNTFSKYSLNDIKNGVELDALKINYRDYYPEAGAYSPERTIYGVLINGTYYNTVQSTSERDSYGNFYYVLKTFQDVEFLRDSYTTISQEKDVNVNLALSYGFDINNPSSWSYTDQILVYEFYKDLSYSNTLRRDPNKGINIGFSSYETDANGNGGVKFPVYKITNKSISSKNEETSGYYALLNGTYYELYNQGGNYYIRGGESGNNFLNMSASEAFIVYEYNFNFDGVQSSVTGIDGGNSSADSFVYQPTSSSIEKELSSADIEKFGSFTLKLSSTFDYKDTSTWSYRDYFLFYLFTKYAGIANSLEELKFVSLSGELCKVDGNFTQISSNKATMMKDKVMFRVEYYQGGILREIYLDVDGVSKISQLKMTSEIDHKTTQSENYFGIGNDSLFARFELGGKLYNAETEYKTFNFSDNFSESVPSSWTVQDMVLLMLVRSGYIESVDSIRNSNGYNSLVYKIGGANYYKFGFGEYGNSVVFLNENNVLNMRFFNNGSTITFASFDEWLSSSALNFIGKLYSVSSSDMIADFNGIADSLYSEISSSVFSISKIIDMLVEENGFIVGKGDTFEIYDEVSKYTYTNPNFVFEDITTWTTLDAAIYYLTGTATNSYTNYVMERNGEKYFVVGNYAINISNGNFKSAIEENNIIMSSKSNVTAAEPNINFAEIVRTSYSDLIFAPEYFLDENGDSILNNYSSSIFRYEVSDTHDANYTYDILEIILHAYEDLGNTFSKEFRVYTDGINKYIRSTDREGNTYYILIGAIGTNAPVIFVERTALTLELAVNKKLFHTNGSYEAFDKFDADNIGSSEFSYLDSLIYYFTGSTEKTSYTIYETENSSGAKRQYILIKDGNRTRFIEYKAADETRFKAAAANSIYANASAAIYLYDIYRSAIRVPSNLKADAIEDVNYTSKFLLSDISTWTPLNILLNELEFISADSDGNFTVNGQIVTSSNGKDKYFRITDSSTSVTYFIYLNEIGEFNEEDKIVTNNTNEIAKLYLNLFLAREQEDGEYTDQSNYIDSNYLTFNKNLNEFLSIDVSVSLKTGLTSSIDANAISSNSTTWTWFDLVYYKLMNRFRTETNFEIYTNSHGMKFIKINQSNNKSKYILLNDVLLLAPQDAQIKSDATGSESYRFELNSSSGFTSLGIIAFKQTGASSGNVSYIKLPTRKVGNSYLYTDKIYFIQNTSNGNNYAIYDIDDTELSASVSDKNIKIVSADGNDILSWNALDLLLKIVSGSSESREINSRVYTYGGSQFLSLGSYYINITKLGLKYDASIDANNLIISSSNESYTQMPKLFGLSQNSTNQIFNTFTSAVGAPQFGASLSTSPSQIKIKFSENFNVEDTNTWTLADFIIYYYFKEGFFKDSKGAVITNFQDLLNQVDSDGRSYVNAYVFYYVNQDSSGNATLKKILSFSNNASLSDGDEMVSYDVFMELYSRKLNHITQTISLNNINIDLKISTQPSIPTTTVALNKFYIVVRADLVSNNFEYSNFYFFNLETTEVEIKDSNGNTVTETRYVFELSGLVNIDVLNLIQSGSSNVKEIGSINLKLSSGFDIKNVNTWTVLDFIIIYEASRSVNGNAFAGKDLNTLKTNTNRISLLTTNDSNRILYINGTCYDLTNYLSKDENNEYELEEDSRDYKVEAKINEIYEKKPEGSDENVSGEILAIVGNGLVDDYSFRFMSQTINFIVNRNFGIKASEFRSPTTFSYILAVDDVETDFYYSVDERVFGNFKIDTNDTIKYPPDHLFISPIVREVNWPQKLMNDMFVIYPNLNWETLIATDGWIDTLGDFTSAYATGNYISQGNSANITAAGLVLSEFFLSIASKTEYGFAEFHYDPVFDESVIKSLMLSLMGEENYKALSHQAEIFSEMFNISFAAVLDDIAAETGIEVVDGKVDNFTISVYKAYLSTILLSSDFGEYLYKIATRVYAQYTIFESLAYAGGDYSRYYAFINGLTDEEGNEVTSFTYGSFYELVKYENAVLGNGSPTFTFNYRKAYRALIDENASDETIRKSLENPEEYKNLFDRIYSQYSQVYGNGGDQLIGDDSDIYCFLFDVYWSTYQRLYKQGYREWSMPDYIKIYNQYLKGEIARWDILDSVDASASTKQIQYLSLYKANLVLNSTKLIFAIIPLYMPSFDLETLDTEDTEDFENKVNNVQITVDSPISIMRQTFADSSEYSTILERVISANPLEIAKDVILSPNGSSESWNNILQVYEDLEKLLNEFGSVCTLGSGVYNSNGSKKVEDIAQGHYDNAYSALNKVYTTFEAYISAQRNLDKITKSSITFMLAQYGQNYVTQGYTFNLENRTYTLTTTSSASRLAEYVYGGSYLAQFGVDPVYTGRDYDGIIEALVAYDHYDGAVKTKLSSFKELRQFVTSLADYTGHLYYLTNFNDLAENVSDSLLLTDYIYANHPLQENSQILITPEFMIMAYLVLQEDVSLDTLIRLMVGDSTSTLEALGVLNDSSYQSITNLVKALESNELSLDDISDEDKKQALIDYMTFIMSDAYTAFGYYNQGRVSTPSERMHSLFKNVITYFITSEDDATTAYENAVRLDNINFKQFRRLLMEKIVDYKQNINETAAENSTRYIALFNLISSQFTYYKYAGSGSVDYENRIGRTISFEHLSYENADGGMVLPKYDENHYLFARFNVDTESRNTVLTLAGIANRPIEELVNLEYDSLYDMNGNYDEAKGDTFIICTYDEIIGKYVPVLARDGNGAAFAEDSSYASYKRAYSNMSVTTSYYNDPSGNPVAQPIVAKGVLTADLRPTAIMMEDHHVKFYRTDISAVANLNDSAINTTLTIQETQTIGFTKFVDTATSKKAGSGNQQAMFMGESSLNSIISTDASLYYLQVNNAYDCTIDGVNCYNVLDTFSYFFTLGMAEYFMLALAFATVFPLMFKASLAAMQRILDLIFLVLMGPVAISLNSINIDDGGKKKDNNVFDKWKNYMTQSILQAFGLIIGFNIYYILMNTLTGMTFVSEFTVSKIQALGGVNIITFNFVNAIVRFLFIITAASVIESAGNLLTQIITLGKVTDAFASPVSGNAFDNIFGKNGILNDMKKALTTAKDAVTGKLLLEAKDAAIQTLKKSLPGAAIVGKAVDAGRWVKNKIAGKVMEKALAAHGVPPDVAKKASKMMIEEQNKQRKAKEKRQTDSANKFMETVGMSEAKFDAPEEKEKKDTKEKKTKKKSKKKKK